MVKENENTSLYCVTSNKQLLTFHKNHFRDERRVKFPSLLPYYPLDRDVTTKSKRCQSHDTKRGQWQTARRTLRNGSKTCGSAFRRSPSKDILGMDNHSKNISWPVNTKRWALRFLPPPENRLSIPWIISNNMKKVCQGTKSPNDAHISHFIIDSCSESPIWKWAYLFELSRFHFYVMFAYEKTDPRQQLLMLSLKKLGNASLPWGRL